jgi:type I restriction enzyme M protein
MINHKNKKTFYTQFKQNTTYECGERRPEGEDNYLSSRGDSENLGRFLSRKSWTRPFKRGKCSHYEIEEWRREMTEITETNILLFLDTMGFRAKDGAENVYTKKYSSGFELTIEVNKTKFSASKINYAPKINSDNDNTANFSQQENFVVLDCVNNLLTKGYKPESIHLEKKWKLGHQNKGRLDIFVLDKSDNPFLMIECKTWDKEYRKEKEKLLYKDGGQLFSYFYQEKKTQYICLYTSVFDNKKIIYDNTIVKITDSIRDSQSQKEAYENWKPQVYENRGIFEPEVKPYMVKFSGLRRRDLIPLTKEDGGDIFNRFAEILRRNVVSDKTNAYNKIFNLFLCKIVDEYEVVDDDKKMKFQWEEGEENETVMLRLNELYKKGMKQYLDLDLSSVEIDELDSQLKNLKSEQDKERIKELFIQQKLYTSNDFAFKEVFDKNTFNLNSIVVKEVVNLLEKYKIRYETKQQFLGDFFEKLLNTGIKQEVGQFFTPVPIAQFICKSLPILDLIKEKNNREEIHILPYFIDYSSGAGHFLTEIMAEINHHIENNLPLESIKNGRALKEFKKYRNDYSWAEEYIYGIEKDYRLAKTTKIATFLNGDGEANIICGDGLDNFKKCRDYRGRLRLKENTKDNEQFDIIIANPPYSVSGFTTTLNEGGESFELWDNFTNKSDEIECLFIERTKQLLTEGGVAGVVLPTNIIESPGIFEKTREILLRNFEIKGIVKLGKNTFMATNTATIILFLRKVKDRKEEFLTLLKKSLAEKKDYVINGITKPIEKYLESSYKITLSNYFEFFSNNKTDDKTLIKTKQYKKYLDDFKKQNKIKLLSKFVELKELEKLFYFIITHNKNLVLYVINSDSVKEESKILGYKFSNRKGYEGIYVFNQGGALYNPKNLYDEKKVSAHILKNYGDEDIQINEEIENLHLFPLNKLMDFHSEVFDKSIRINQYESKKNRTLENARKALAKLNEEKIIAECKLLVEKYRRSTVVTDMKIKTVLKRDIETGGTPHTRTLEFWNEGTINWLTIGDIQDKYVTETDKKITPAGKKDKNLKEYDEGTVLFSIFGSIGKLGILKTKTTLNQAICALIPDEKKINEEYLYYILMMERENIASGRLHRTQDNINQTKVAEHEIPVIKDIKKQKEFVEKIKKLETSLNKEFK